MKTKWTAQEEFESGARMAVIRIHSWIFNFPLPEAKIRARGALAELNPKSAPCVAGMVKELTDFLTD